MTLPAWAMSACAWAKTGVTNESLLSFPKDSSLEHRSENKLRCAVRRDSQGVGMWRGNLRLYQPRGEYISACVCIRLNA